MASVAFAPRKIMRAHNAQLRLLGVNADSSFTIMKGYAITAVYIENLTANPVTGGLNCGITDGGNGIFTVIPAAGNDVKHIAEALLLLRYFSRVADQVIYLTAVSAWNNASLNVTFCLDKVSP